MMKCSACNHMIEDSQFKIEMRAGPEEMVPFHLLCFLSGNFVHLQNFLRQQVPGGQVTHG